MFIPRKGTPGRVVVETIYEHGPLTFEQGLEAHKPFDIYLSRTREVYKRAVESGWLVEENGVYSLTPAMTEHLDNQPVEEKTTAQPTPAADPPPFRPLSLKQLPSLQPRRADAAPPREIFYFCGSARPEPFRGTVNGAD
jgi:hypothetical protein